MFRRATLSFSFLLTSVAVTIASTASAQTIPANADVPTAVLPLAPPSGTPSPTADNARASAPHDTTAARADGASFQLHAGAMIPMGSVVDGVSIRDSVSSAYTGELRVSLYPNTHFGVMLGVGGDAYSVECDKSDECSGFGYRVPVGVEYAFQNRLEGAFATAAINVLSGVTFSAPRDSATFRANVAEAELGFGWRFALPNTRSAIVPRVSFVAGEYNDAKINLTGARGMNGSIPGEARALHYAIAFSAGYHFGS